MAIDAELLEILACPNCKTPVVLVKDGKGLKCNTCHRVYPIKDFGAIEQGSHRFCQFDTGSCDGLADFTIIWKQGPAGWQMTRVLSYGHRATQ